MADANTDTPTTTRRKRAAVVSTVHGTEVTSGDTKKGGSAKSAVVTLMDLDKIEIQPGFNPRKVLGDTETLAKSIKAEGLLSALVVRPAEEEGKFWLVAGERRYRSLKGLEWDKPVPVIIRSDLKEDDDRALAVAVAENSEDGRQNLNYIEIGRVVHRLVGKGWTPAKIAKETGLHSQKVRRAASLMEAPDDLQVKVEENQVSMRTALEVMKLDDKTRKAVIAELTPTTTEKDVRKIRKEVEASGETPKKTDGRSTNRAVTAWRGSREKQDQLRRLCHFLVAAHDDAEQVGTADFHEVRGMVGYALWDRGDLADPVLPAFDVSEEDDPKAAAAQNNIFMKVVRAEADKYEPQGND
jgi:ParB family chromosome partitioning protein